MMEVATLLALPDGLEVAQLSIVDDTVATAERRTCPLYAEAATHVRSYYTRMAADLPCAGHRVQLIFHVRKFRCDTASCLPTVLTQRSFLAFSSILPIAAESCRRISFASSNERTDTSLQETGPRPGLHIARGIVPTRILARGRKIR